MSQRWEKRRRKVREQKKKKDNVSKYTVIMCATPNSLEHCSRRDQSSFGSMPAALRVRQPPPLRANKQVGATTATVVDYYTPGAPLISSGNSAPNKSTFRPRSRAVAQRTLPDYYIELLASMGKAALMLSMIKT